MCGAICLLAFGLQPIMTGTTGAAEDPESISPLQADIDRASPGSVVTVSPGTYRGDLTIDRPIRLVGIGRPTLIGSGRGTVVRIRANGVTIEGFDIDGQNGGSLADDSSGIHVSGKAVVIRDCRIVRSLFGIYLQEADGATVEGCTIEGQPGRDPGDQGSGVHLFSTNGFLLSRNHVRYSRDGFYFQSSSRGKVTGNVASDVRYGLHYMSSDDNTFEDNLFERGAAGAAIMYSRRIQFRRNRFLHNRGFASVGLLIQSCDDLVAEDNLVADNARGFFLEGTSRLVFRRNVVAESDVAVVLYDSTSQTRFEGNAFVGNLTPLQLVGRRTDAVFRGNYWSEHDEPDLDGDGVRDRPYRLENVFDHFRGNLTAADLFAQGWGAAAVAAAERMFPLLEIASIEDARPLARMPMLENVPRAPVDAGRDAWKGLMASVLLLTGGLGILGSGWRVARV